MHSLKCVAAPWDHASHADHCCLACPRPQVTSTGLIGYSAIQTDTFEECDEFMMAYVYEIQLRSSYHRKGFGTLLMREATHAGRSAGAHGFLLTVHKRNHKARKFYGACDFHVSSVSPSEEDEADYLIFYHLW